MKHQCVVMTFKVAVCIVMLPPLPPRYPVYVSSLYCDVSAVSLILSVYIVMLLSAVLLPCLCCLSTLRCSTLQLPAAVLFTLTACTYCDVRPFCLRCSPVLTLYAHIPPVSPCCSPVDDNCVHCDAYPPFLSTMQLSSLAFLSFTFVCHLKQI
jgi:hypothetical protein